MLRHFTVSFPTDEGYIGRECNNSKCRRYFRIHGEDIKDRMFCPYCGKQYGKDEYYTKDQLEHTRRVAQEEARKYAHDAMSKMLRETFGNRPRNGFISWEVKASNYQKQPVVPRYKERKVDSALACHDCKVRFQVDGIFGFCPGCRAEQIRIYDANIAIIRQEVKEGPNAQRALRHAYADLVSTFELLCKQRAQKLAAGVSGSQNLNVMRQFFQDKCGTDVFDGLTVDEFLCLRRVFQKRHLFTHGTELIDERYVKNVPEDAQFLGQTPKLSLAEFGSAATALRKVVDRIVAITI